MLRRGTGIYIVALVAVAAMLMLVSLYAELRNELASYAKLVREDVESASEEVSLSFNSTSNTLSVASSSGSSLAEAVVFVTNDRVYVQKLREPMPMRSGMKIDLSALPLYSELKHEGKRIDRICVVTNNLNLFCAGEHGDASAKLLRSIERIEKEIARLRTSIQNTVREEVASVEKSVVEVYRSSRLLPVLASLMNQYDYLSLTSRYMPIDSAVLKIPSIYRYFTIEFSYSIEENGIRYSAKLTGGYPWMVLARSFGTIELSKRGRYVDILNFTKAIPQGSLVLTVSIDLDYFVKKGVVYGKDAVALVPRIVVTYRVAPRDSSLKMLSFWDRDVFSVLRSACDPEYDSDCSGFRGMWFESRPSVAGWKTPHTRSSVVEAPKPLGSYDSYVYLFGKSIVFRYRYAEAWNVDTDLAAWIYVGKSGRDVLKLYLPWPADYRSYSSLVFLVKSMG